MQTTSKLDAKLVKFHSADLGNRALKWCDNLGNIHKIPSFVHTLRDFEDTPEYLDEQSVYLETGEVRIVLGKLASELGGRAIYQLNKTELAPILLMASIAPVQGSHLPLLIQELRVCLPDRRDTAAVANLKKLEGSHTLVRNGKKFSYEIQSTKIFDEAVGSFRYAKHHGLFQYGTKINAIADFGGGTLILRLFSPSGSILREADIILDGTFALASTIAATLLPRLGKSADLSLIMNGISDGSYRYGCTDVVFKAEFLKCQADFVETIRLTIKERWQKFFPELGEVLLTGGSPPLLVSLANSPNSRFKLAKNHQFINVLGMNLEA